MVFMNAAPCQWIFFWGGGGGGINNKLKPRMTSCRHQTGAILVEGENRATASEFLHAFAFSINKSTYYLFS